MDSSEDDNPYDFALKYRKLLTKKKKNKSLSKSELKSQLNVDEKSVVIDLLESDYTSVTTTAITTANMSQPCRITRSQSTRRNSKEKSNEPHNVIEPVICIGDFDNSYENTLLALTTQGDNNNADKLANLFSFDEWQKKNAEDDEDAQFAVEANRIMNVKVFWRKSQIYRFPLRMTIESIYDYFAKLENIPTSCIYLELNKKPLSPSNTPNSINYKIVDFIDGEIEFYKSIDDTSKIAEVKEQSNNEVKFRVTQEDVKIPIFMSMKKTDKMIILYVKLAEKLGLDLESFSLKFDGDQIKNSDTMESLDLEGGECFELQKKKKNNQH